MTSTRPLISIILPIYNAEKYLEFALRSLFYQTEQNFEIIAIDDGSTDNSLSILSKYPDHRLNIISRPNQGLVATLNEAVKISKGKYIARMDADDICLEKRLESQYYYLKSNPSIALVCNSIHIINDQGTKIGERLTKKTRIIQLEELIFGNPIVHPTVMFNMEVLNKEDILYNSYYPYTEDFELWTRIIQKHKTVQLKEVLLQYRVHVNSTTGKHQKKQREQAKRAIATNIFHNQSMLLFDSLAIIYNFKETKFTYIKTLQAIFIVLKRSLNAPSISKIKLVKQCIHLFYDKLFSNGKNLNIRTLHEKKTK